MILRDIVLTDNTHITRFKGSELFIRSIGLSNSFDGDIVYYNTLHSLLLDTKIFGVLQASNYTSYWEVNAYQFCVLDKYEIQLLDYISKVEEIKDDNYTYDVVMFMQSMTDEFRFILNKEGNNWTILDCILDLFKDDRLTLLDDSFLLEFDDKVIYRYYLNISIVEFKRFLVKVLTLRKNY